MSFLCCVLSLFATHSLTRVSFLHTRVKMVCLCWLLVVVLACVCVPGFGSECWESSMCNNQSNRGKILVGQPVFSMIYCSVYSLLLPSLGRARQGALISGYKENKNRLKERLQKHKKYNFVLQVAVKENFWSVQSFSDSYLIFWCSNPGRQALIKLGKLEN